MIKTRVAIYIRISGCREDYQKRQIARWEREIARCADWELAGMYVDTGTSASRMEFLRLIEDCKRGKVDLIVTPTVTRFGRGIVDAMNTVRQLYLQPHSVGCCLKRKTSTPPGTGTFPRFCTCTRWS